MECPYCHKIHLDTDKFCVETGKPLTLKCPNGKCEGNRNPLPLSNKFCPYCGTSLNASNDNKENKESGKKVKTEKATPINLPPDGTSPNVSQTVSSNTYKRTDDEDRIEGCFNTTWQVIFGIGAICFWLKYILNSCH